MSNLRKQASRAVNARYHLVPHDAEPDAHAAARGVSERDFRLVAVEDQAALPDSYNTQKLIPVLRNEWTALIAYMGIQSAPPLLDDMGQWIVEQIDRIPPAGDFSELSTRLRQLDRWLPRFSGDRRVAFSVVGFGIVGRS